MSEWSLLSRVQLFATPWIVAYRAPPTMGFSRQEYWSGLPFPSPGDLPSPGIKPRYPALEADALTSEPPGKPYQIVIRLSERLSWTTLSKIDFYPNPITLCPLTIFSCCVSFFFFFFGNLFILHFNSLTTVLWVILEYKFIDSCYLLLIFLFFIIPWPIVVIKYVLIEW